MRLSKNTRSQQNRSTPRANRRGRVKPVITANYIVGLVDGEGCFYVLVRNPKGHKWWTRVQMHLYIKMKQEDKKLLEQVRNFFGCGFIYYQKDKRKDHDQCFRFEINAQKDIQNIVIPFFKRHPLQSSKHKDFKLFYKIAKEIRAKRHLTDEGLEKIRNLKMQMNHGTRRVREIRSHGGNAK